MQDFYPHQPAGVGGAKASLHNCVDIFHKYCSQVLRQPPNKDELYIYETQQIRALGPELREVLCAVRFPTPDGYVTVHLNEVNTHWGEVTEEQVAGTQFASKTRAEFERRRFLYTVIVRMSQLGCLDASLNPSAGALAGTRSAVDAQKLPNQLVLGDSFAPDSGEAPGPATRPVPAPSTSVPASPIVSEASPSNVSPIVSPMPPMPPARWLQSSSPPPQQQQAPPQAPSQAPPPQQQQTPSQVTTGAQRKQARQEAHQARQAQEQAEAAQRKRERAASAGSDSKSQLSKMVMLRWRTAGTDSSVLRYDSQLLPSGGYVATVTLGRCNSGAGASRTEGEATSKKGAEQLAAALAVMYLEQLPSSDQ